MNFPILLKDVEKKFVQDYRAELEFEDYTRVGGPDGAMYMNSRSASFEN